MEVITKKKISIGALLVASVCIFAGVFFTACGSSDTMFGNTYVYAGLYAGYNDGIGSSITWESKEKGKIIEDNLDKVDWAKTLNDESFNENVTTMERAKELIKAKAGDSLDKAYDGYTVSFGNGSIKTIKFEDKEYLGKSEKEMPGWVEIYDKDDITFSGIDIGDFRYAQSGNELIVLYSHDDLSGKTDRESYTNVEVYFTEPVSIPGGTTQSISITFYASFALQK